MNILYEIRSCGSVMLEKWPFIVPNFYGHYCIFCVISSYHSFQGVKEKLCKYELVHRGVWCCIFFLNNVPGFQTAIFHCKLPVRVSIEHTIYNQLLQLWWLKLSTHIPNIMSKCTKELGIENLCFDKMTAFQT